MASFYLGINEIPMPKRLAMASAIRVIKEVIQESLSHYKTDRYANPDTYVYSNARAPARTDIQIKISYCISYVSA